MTESEREDEDQMQFLREWAQEKAERANEKRVRRQIARAHMYHFWERIRALFGRR